MSAGIDQSVEVLTGSNASGLANKVIILLSDGVWNAGRNPLDAARDARDRRIVIHTVSMLSTDAGTLRSVADITGGKFYSATNSTELRAAFYKLARTLPFVLTDSAYAYGSQTAKIRFPTSGSGTPRHPDR